MRVSTQLKELIAELRHKYSELGKGVSGAWEETAAVFQGLDLARQTLETIEKDDTTGERKLPDFDAAYDDGDRVLMMIPLLKQYGTLGENCAEQLKKAAAALKALQQKMNPSRS